MSQIWVEVPVLSCAGVCGCLAAAILVLWLHEASGNCKSITFHECCVLGRLLMENLQAWSVLQYQQHPFLPKAWGPFVLQHGN